MRKDSFSPLRRECLDRFVPLSERHLRTAVTEYVVHYHTERNHQGLGNELITPLPASPTDAGPIVSRERLGGILNYRLDCGRDGGPSVDSTGVAWKHSFRNTLGYSLSTRWSSAW